MTARDLSRFWKKVEVTDGCWLWTGGLKGGYGRFYFERARKQAHWVAYELIVGDVPEGMELHHECGNKACVNVAHLEPMTHADHMRRHPESYERALRYSVVAKRAITHCPHGHAYDEANTYYYGPRRYRICRACSLAHGARQRQRKLLERSRS